jgi:apolipoprotein N-acyltransferase
MSAIYLSLSLLTGGLLALSFAPLNFYLLAILCPSYLLWACFMSRTANQAALVGFLFGLGFFGVGISWVFISIHTYTDTHYLIAGLITALFASLLALVIALQSYLFKRFFLQIAQPLFLQWLIFPACWVLIEWVRSYTLTGFPWLLLGVSQVNSPLAAYGPLIGIYGLSFMTVLPSGPLLTVLGKWPPTKTQFKLKRCMAILFLLGLSLSTYFLGKISWVQASGPPIKMSLIQGNIPQDLKWEPQHLDSTLKLYENLTQAHWDSRLIIWPESAIPAPPTQVSAFLQNLDQEAKRHGATLITGIPLQLSNSHFQNAILALGQDQACYIKRKLVIFGEYIPQWLEWARGLTGLLDIPLTFFRPGPLKQVDFKIANIIIAPFICYEIAYPSLIRTALPTAHLLLTLSNDAWFGDSFAPGQHLQIAQAQALVTGRYLAFLSNTGLTAMINIQGQIETKIPAFTRDTLTSLAIPYQGVTPWVRFGDTPILVLASIILLGCYLRSKDLLRKAHYARD